MGLVVFSKVLFNCVKLEEGNIVSGQAALRDEIPFSSWRYVCEPQLLGEAPKKAWGAYLFPKSKISALPVHLEALSACTICTWSWCS